MKKSVLILVGVAIAILIGFSVMSQFLSNQSRNNEETIVQDTISGNVKGIEIEASILSSEQLNELTKTDLENVNYGVFLTLDTHSGDLKNYDLKEIIRIESFKGEFIKPSNYVVIKELAHHRHGILIFENDLFLEQKPLKLIIDELGGEKFEADWGIDRQ